MVNVQLWKTNSQNSLKQYRGMPDSSGLLTRQAQS